MEWIHPVEGAIKKAPAIRGGAKRSLRAPFKGEAAVYLKGEKAQK